VTWELSADGGSNWTDFTPDGSWSRLTITGAELLWRSALSWSSGVDPAVSELTLDWLVESAPIASVTDVPDDQGGWVRVNFLRSGYDFGDETVYPVAGYQIYQLVDESNVPQTASEDPFDTGPSAFEVAPLAGLRVWNEGGRTLARCDTKAAGAFPPGTWEAVGWVAGMQVDDYTIRVSTTADSQLSTYLVTTHTTTPSIAPGVPQVIQAGYMATGVTLDWDDAPEADFQFYRIYRGADEGFVPSPDNLVHTTTSSIWTDPTANPWYYHYKITVLDHAGNESEPGAPTSVSGTGDGAVPAATALLGAVPNPFNPSTNLSFTLAAAGHARLTIYDVAGRLVATLVDEHRDIGRHHVAWEGLDGGGRRLASGVYFYRLETGTYSETKRMVMVK